MTRSYPRDGRRDWSLDWTLADEPLGAAIVRDGLANNVLHAADQACAQPLVVWSCPVTSLTLGNAEDRILATSVGSRWTRVTGFGPMRLSTKIADGARSAYTLRVEVAGVVSDAIEVEIAVLVTPPGRMPYVLESSEIVSGASAEIFRTSSTSEAWLAPDGTGSITLSPSALSACMQTIDTLTEPSGDASSAVTAQIEIGIFVRTDGVGVSAEVIALHVAEVWT